MLLMNTITSQVLDLKAEVFDDFKTDGYVMRRLEESDYHKGTHSRFSSMS